MARMNIRLDREDTRAIRDMTRDDTLDVIGRVVVKNVKREARKKIRKNAWTRLAYDLLK